MLETSIYISVTRGKETLILDGNLLLFRELLQTLHVATHEFTEYSNAPIAASLPNELEGEGGHATD